MLIAVAMPAIVSAPAYAAKAGVQTVNRTARVAAPALRDTGSDANVRLDLARDPHDDR
jgi:hypothetical protein